MKPTHSFQDRHEAAVQDSKIPADFDFVEGVHKRSIPTVGMDVIFTHDEIVKRKVSGTPPSGGKTDVEMNFVSACGFLATKAHTLSNAKRFRDAFDIFLTVRQSPDKTGLIDRCRKLLSDDEYERAITKIASAFASGKAVASAGRVLEHLGWPAIGNEPYKTVSDEMSGFFESLGIRPEP